MLDNDVETHKNFQRRHRQPPSKPLWPSNQADSLSSGRTPGRRCPPSPLISSGRRLLRRFRLRLSLRSPFLCSNLPLLRPFQFPLRFLLASGHLINTSSHTRSFRTPRRFPLRFTSLAISFPSRFYLFDYGFDFLFDFLTLRFVFSTHFFTTSIVGL